MVIFSLAPAQLKLRLCREYGSWLSAMESLDLEIRRLAREIRAVEQLLIDTCGLVPVDAPAKSRGGYRWLRRAGGWFRRALHSASRMLGSEANLAVRVPQPD